MGKKLTQEEFIEKAKSVHGDKYKYDSSIYSGMNEKINIICSSHNIFQQTPSKHLSGRGCPSCNEYQTLDTEEFIKRAKKIYGDKYDYSLVEYVNSKTKVNVLCGIHGLFKTSLLNHCVKKRGCPKCGIEKLRLTRDQFIKKAIEIHGNKYDYSLVNYVNCREKVDILCKEHGKFSIEAKSHLYNKNSCPVCNESKGEKFIRVFLEKENVKHVRQKKFDTCKHKRHLKFDFYLPEYNILIEYDGEQHFRNLKSFGGLKRLKLDQSRDRIKTKYAEDNGIKLIRIPHTEYNNIEEILENNLMKLISNK